MTNRLIIPLTCPGKITPIMVGTNPNDGTALMFRPRCKLWSCEVCAPINKALWTVRAYHGAEVVVGEREDAVLHFLTLTSRGDLTPAQSLYVFPRAWKKLHARARRAQKGYHYFMVPERQRSGRIHMHTITTLAMTTRWWKDNGAQCGLGFMNENDPCRSPAFAAWYAAKYLAKSIMVETWPKGFRRTRLSHNWPKLPQCERDENWAFRVLPAGADPGAEYQILLAWGYEVRVLNGIEAWQAVGDWGAEKGAKGDE